MKTISFKSFILVLLIALGTTVFAQQTTQQKEPLKSKPKPSSGNTNVSPTMQAKPNTTPSASGTAQPATEPAKSKPSETNNGDSEMEQNRGAISEQGMPSDQPKMKPATSTSVPVSNTPTSKPKTDSKSSGAVLPK